MYETQHPDRHRRTFLKRSAYAAPTLMLLGAIGHTTKANAGYGSPPSDPQGSTSSSEPQAQQSAAPASSGDDSLVLDTL